MPEKKALLVISNGKSVGENGALARNAHETMGGLFAANPCEMSHKDCISVYEKCYR
jgi:hypothetical protein